MSGWKIYCTAWMQARLEPRNRARAMPASDLLPGLRVGLSVAARYPRRGMVLTDLAPELYRRVHAGVVADRQPCGRAEATQRGACTPCVVSSSPTAIAGS